MDYIRYWGCLSTHRIGSINACCSSIRVCCIHRSDISSRNYASIQVNVWIITDRRRPMYTCGYRV